ncbi:MAG: hypothetical protein K9M96_07745 [Deltaproteobacteria bacterium]|nr:hypothetical protein [Deltaproteobacteria bacterium]
MGQYLLKMTDVGPVGGKGRQGINSSQRGKCGFFDEVVMGRSPIPTHTRNRGIDQAVAPVFTIDARVVGCTSRPLPQHPG